MSFSRQIAQTDVLPIGPWSGFKTGKFFLAVPDGTTSTGQAPGANSIRLYPFYIPQAVTFDLFGVTVTTLSASGNVQAALYGPDTSTLYPKGNPLASTASMSTTNVAAVSSAASVQITTPGLYWAATNCDNATAAFLANSSTSTFMSRLLGSATLSEVMATAGGTMSGIVIAQTYGTWPNLSGVETDFTKVTVSQRIPLIACRVSSIP